MSKSFIKDKGQSSIINLVDETHELSIYLAGVAKGSNCPHMERAAYWLNRLSSNICGSGYIGCSYGPSCTSDHK